MSGSPLVRTIRPDEAAALAALHVQCFPDAWSQETFEALLVRPHLIALGAMVNADGELKGFILIQIIADEGEVLTFCVEPGSRGHKLGTALLSAAASFAGALGANRMFLEVSENNPAARTLYEHHEFVVVGRRSAYYRESGSADAGVDALIMRKTLSTGAASAN